MCQSQVWPTKYRLHQDCTLKKIKMLIFTSGQRFLNDADMVTRHVEISLSQAKSV